VAQTTKIIFDFLCDQREKKKKKKMVQKHFGLAFHGIDQESKKTIVSHNFKREEVT